MKNFLAVAFSLTLILIASGCVQHQSNGESIEYEYYNNSNHNITIAERDFKFKINGNNEFWTKENRTTKFYVVFNNIDDDEKPHEFIARMHPAAADFDVMSAYQCMHFTLCAPLIRDMKDFTVQPILTKHINYGFVDLYTMSITVPEDTPKGTYVYNLVACQDMEFSECSETKANWGPNIPITLHVL